MLGDQIDDVAQIRIGVSVVAAAAVVGHARVPRDAVEARGLEEVAQARAEGQRRGEGGDADGGTDHGAADRHRGAAPSRLEGHARPGDDGRREAGPGDAAGKDRRPVAREVSGRRGTSRAPGGVGREGGDEGNHPQGPAHRRALSGTPLPGQVSVGRDRRRVVVVPNYLPKPEPAVNGEAVALLEKALSQKSWPTVIPLVRAALKALRGGSHESEHL